MVKKTDFDIKVTEIENKLDNHNHDKYVTAPEFNTLSGDVFNAGLTRANLVAKTDFDAKSSILTAKLWKIKQKNYLFKMS